MDWPWYTVEEVARLQQISVADAEDFIHDMLLFRAWQADVDGRYRAKDAVLCGPDWMTSRELARAMGLTVEDVLRSLRKAARMDMAEARIDLFRGLVYRVHHSGPIPWWRQR